MALPPKTDHKIALADARKAVARHRAAHRAAAAAVGAQPTGPYGFHAEAFHRILGQPGCVGIRVYPATHDDGQQSLVLVGVDGQGNDMTGGELANDPWRCPPFCPPEESALTSGS
jgi:hypothetical protein